MSDVSGITPDTGLPDLSAASSARSAAGPDQRWTASTLLKVLAMVVAALPAAVFTVVAIASGSLAAAILVPIALIALAVVGSYRLWRWSVELTGDGSLIVRNLLRTRHVPVSQILSMRRSEYGIRINLIDGRNVTAGALQTGLWRQHGRRPDRAANAISAIAQAVESARSARPAETAAAIDAAAPLRAKRTIRRLVVAILLGPAMLIASFFVPAAGLGLDTRLRWFGIAYTVLSLAAGYRLLGLVRPKAGRAHRKRSGRHSA